MKNVNKLKVRKVKAVTNPIIKNMLTTCAVAGVVGAVIVAPNSAQAFSIFIKKSDEKNNKAKRFNEHAKRSGYFETEQVSANRYAIKLTQKGSSVARNLIFDDYKIPKPPDWDGKWHLLMFDISEQNRLLRDALRAKIAELGMVLIQNSVYVYPYPINDFIDNLHIVYPESTKLVLHATATQIDGEDQLIERFSNNKTL